jgi:hypothetical protein
LREQGRLAEPGARHDDRDRVLPSGVEPVEQAPPLELVGERNGKATESGTRQRSH